MSARQAPGLGGLQDDLKRMVQAQAATPAPVAQEPAKKEEPAMSRRSWYTATSASEAFAQAVDDLHHATRVPKHVVVAALMEAAVTHKTDVYDQLMERHPLPPPA